MWLLKTKVSTPVGHKKYIKVTTNHDNADCLHDVNVQPDVLWSLECLEDHPASPFAEKVLFDVLGVSAELPLGKPMMVTVMPDKPGEYEFTCQMRMYRGTLIAR